MISQTIATPTRRTASSARLVLTMLVLTYTLNFIEKGLDEEYEKYKVDFNPLDVVLYPPGKCLHLYRDGVGVSAAYVPCTFFKEIDVTRTMLVDHGTSDGYDSVFHEMMSRHLRQIRFNFPHDIEKATVKKGS